MPPVIAHSDEDATLRQLSWAAELARTQLEVHGSLAEPGFARPEGTVTYHSRSDTLLKDPFDK